MGKFQKLGLYLRTARHVKPSQITNRIKRRLFPAKVNLSPAPALRSKLNRDYNFIQRPKSILGKNTFLFLNKQETLTFPEGWNDANLPKLWIYNLHYFDGLMNTETPNELKQNLIEQWIAENPPGYGNGWEPYPNSLRISNWIKWARQDNSLSEAATQSLAVQTRYLMKTIEYHLLGNHLFANAKALVFSGLFFSGPEADTWLQSGMEILRKQIPEQFNTGIHFELSTTYHTLLLEDLLDLSFLLKDTKYDISKLGPPLEILLETTQNITRPDGAMPLFNDAAYGITPTTAEILAYAASFNLYPDNAPSLGMKDFAPSGYFKFDAVDYSYIGDAGAIGPDYLPAHVHCDMLSFELFTCGQPLIVDTGTSTYEIGSRRNHERSTAAHNTVQVGKREQSQIWSAFRVAHRAKVISRTIGKDTVTASLKSLGYKHRRDIDFSKDTIVIKDSVKQNHNSEICTVRYHFHPNVAVELDGLYVHAGPISLSFENAKTCSLVEYSYAPEFNKLLPAICLEVTFGKTVSTTITINK